MIYCDCRQMRKLLLKNKQKNPNQQNQPPQSKAQPQAAALPKLPQPGCPWGGTRDPGARGPCGRARGQHPVPRVPTGGATRSCTTGTGSSLEPHSCSVLNRCRNHHRNVKIRDAFVRGAEGTPRPTVLEILSCFVDVPTQAQGRSLRQDSSDLLAGVFSTPGLNPRFAIAWQGLQLAGEETQWERKKSL